MEKKDCYREEVEILCRQVKVQYMHGMTPGHKFNVTRSKKELTFYKKWENSNAEVMTKMHSAVDVLT